MTPDQIAALPYRPCVGLVLSNREGLVFGGQRIDMAAPAWQMPQGGIDEGESAEKAGLRELHEEVGLTPDRVRILARTPKPLRYDLPEALVPNIWGGRFRGQEQAWLLLRFEGADSEIDIATPEPEFSAWRWLTPAELLDSIVPFKRAIYERVLAEFAPHLA